jgi:hypothetical protein
VEIESFHQGWTSNNKLQITGSVLFILVTTYSVFFIYFHQLNCCRCIIKWPVVINVALLLWQGRKHQDCALNFDAMHNPLLVKAELQSFALNYQVNLLFSISILFKFFFHFFIHCKWQGFFNSISHCSPTFC